MEDSLLTKCPHCQTLFRIKYEHLAVADGEVRCGVCFKVFNASEQGLSYSEGQGSDANSTFGRREPSEQHQHNEGKQHAADSPAVAAPDQPFSSTGDPILPANLDSDDEATEDTIPSAAQLAELQIAEETLETQLLSDQGPPRGSSRGLLWSCLTCAAMLLLAVQYFWSNAERYAYHSDLHIWYHTICNAVGCSLPEYRDIKQLKSERLEVRSHPDFQNVLMIDMIVSNSGIAPQPLPEISLSFFDINGITVAQRIFNHHDYLKDLDRPTTALPVKKPIQVSFAILDPGERAVNYTVTFK